MPSVSYSKTAAQCNTELYVRNLMEIISAGLYSACIYIKGTKNIDDLKEAIGEDTIKLQNDHKTNANILFFFRLRFSF